MGLPSKDSVIVSNGMPCEAEAVTLSAALLVFREGSLAAKSLVHRFASDGTLLEERVSLISGTGCTVGWLGGESDPPYAGLAGNKVATAGNRH